MSEPFIYFSLPSILELYSMCEHIYTVKANNSSASCLLVTVSNKLLQWRCELLTYVRALIDSAELQLFAAALLMRSNGGSYAKQLD